MQTINRPTTMLQGLTDADVLAYLASKQGHESIGYCADAAACIIAEAYRHKYGIAVCVDEEDQGIIIKYPEKLTFYPLTPMMRNMLHIFDQIDIPGVPILKSTFMAAWDAFKARRWRKGHS